MNIWNQIAQDSCKQELYKITSFCAFTDAYEF